MFNLNVDFVSKNIDLTKATILVGIGYAYSNINRPVSCLSITFTANNPVDHAFCDMIKNSRIAKLYTFPGGK